MVSALAPVIVIVLWLYGIASMAHIAEKRWNMEPDPERPLQFVVVLGLIIFLAFSFIALPISLYYWCRDRRAAKAKPRGATRA